MKFLSQDDYTKDTERGLKVIGGANTVIHCHHYNSRLQRTIEGNSKVDGETIIRSAAAISYHRILKDLVSHKKSGDNYEIGEELYSFLGFGTLDFSKIDQGFIFSNNSHFVEGWRCGSVKTEGTVCRMTEGYIEGACKAIRGADVAVTEVECMNQGHDSCKFKVDTLEKSKYTYDIERFSQFSFDKNTLSKEEDSNIDKKAIIEAVLGMPLEGNDEGLIPAFNVYLAHTPQDFYNLVSINFIDEMRKNGLDAIAQEMLVEDAENCALNTFGGILDSQEWSALIAPMVKEEKDIIFGLVAVANALGWGRINIIEHTPYRTLELDSYNGYEAHGFLEFKGYNDMAQCFMLKGVAAGLMALVYEKGELEDRAGKYIGNEELCLTKKDAICCFKVTL